MDALSSNAVPWRLTAAALVLDEQLRDPATQFNAGTVRRIMRRFGFLYPGEISNLPAGVSRAQTEFPLGITHGTIAPIGGTAVLVANLGCAACHAGATYNSDGQPQPQSAALGMPNTSLDLEAYTMAVFEALRRHVGTERLLQTVDTLFGEMSASERFSLRYLVLPLVKRRLGALEKVDRPMPFSNGLPGSTNGVAALKAAFGTPLLEGGAGDAGFVSIPDLGHRTWKSALLTDGAYSVPAQPPVRTLTATDINPDHLDALATITSFFTVPSMGVHPDNAKTKRKDVSEVLAFLVKYRPQSYPGMIDMTAAQRGAETYSRECASCHGRYEFKGESVKLVQFPNWIGDVGTDPLRGQSFDTALSNALAQTSYKDSISVQTGRGYMAPPLTGLWASAPYLHNGSVPTVDALLTPSRRPARFNVGGHRLDFEKLGIALQADGNFPAGYGPFSTPASTDTSRPGLSNIGHTFGEGLTESEKTDLIAFLKLL